MSELHAASHTLLFKRSLYLDIFNSTIDSKTYISNMDAESKDFKNPSTLFNCLNFFALNSVSTGYLRKFFIVILRNMLPKNNDRSAEKCF